MEGRFDCFVERSLVAGAAACWAVSLDDLIGDLWTSRMTVLLILEIDDVVVVRDVDPTGCVMGEASGLTGDRLCALCSSL